MHDLKMEQLNESVINLASVDITINYHFDNFCCHFGNYWFISLKSVCYEC